MTSGFGCVRILYANFIEIVFLDKLVLFLVCLFRRRFSVVTYAECWNSSVFYSI